MNIFIISDLHGNLDRAIKFGFLIKEISPELVLVAGDITNFGPLETASQILNALVRGGSKTVFVPGNCDPAELLDMDEVDGALNLHGKRTAWRNHDLIGIGGSNPTPFQSLIAFSEREIQRILSGFKASSNSFILSHVPPYGTRLDRVFLGRHVGSRALRKFIGEYNPLAAVVGHVHEGRGKQMLGSTVIVNPGPGARGFYGLMELGSDAVEVTLSQI